MILLADSGSTKTDWCVVEQGELVQQLSTKGINPFFESQEEIAQEVAAYLVPYLQGATLESVHFYGAGCTLEKAPIVHSAITSQLTVTGMVTVNTDMLAAARSMCGHQPGIACILGTGSNSCLYDGSKIVSNVSPLGFILGDEGSGAVLGRLLVGDILKNRTSPVLKEKFLTQYELTLPAIIDRVYRQPFPNRFLAGLSPFLAQNLNEPSIRLLVLNSFNAFLQRNVMQYAYQQHSVHFVGSVAFYYQEILRQAAQDLGIQIGAIIQSPMQGLIAFHNQQHI